MKNQDIRWKQRFQNYQKALVQLEQAVELSRQRELSELERQGLVQAFEFTRELAWNTLKDFLASRGVANIFGSRDATREAFAQGIITDGETWMRMIQSRNESSHTYNVSVAEQIVAAATNDYLSEFVKLRDKLEQLRKENPNV